MPMALRTIDILAFFSRRPQAAFKTKDLARELGLPKTGPAYQRLKEILRELQDAGEIDRVEGRKWGRVRGEEEMDGVLTILANGDAVVRAEGHMGREVVVPWEKLSAAEDGDRVRIRIEPGAVRRRPRGVVTEILASADTVLVGQVRTHGGRSVFTADGKQEGGKVAIPLGRRATCEDGDKIVIRRRGKGPNAEVEILDRLGPAGDIDVELRAIARRFGLSEQFPPDVEREVDAIPSRIGAKDLAGRLDLRDEDIFTIDPDDAKDFDDAVSLHMQEDGQAVLGVHIADVSHYVRPDTALDRDAQARGTSVYFPGMVLPMLPEQLSNGLCSLKEGKDRLTYSVFMTISPRGALKDYALRKSVIRSKKRFTYSEAQSVLDRGEGTQHSTLRAMAQLAHQLRRKRIREGSIDFELPEVAFRFDDRGHPSDIVVVERLDTMRMIEEFMLMANRCVARAIEDFGTRTARMPFLYRVHDLPDADKVKELITFLRHLGVKASLDPNRSSSFQQMLASIQHLPKRAVIEDMTVRTMAKAAYSEKNIGHFGLAFSRYAHFTSPIRRYPDLLVHRILAACQNGAWAEARAAYRTRIAELGVISSQRERNAVEAERAAIKYLESVYMQSHVGDEFEGVISGVQPYGLFIELLPSLVEGLVHVRSLERDIFDYHAGKRALIGRRRGTSYRLGDSVRVRVVRVDPEDRHIDLMLVS